jgi:hypothetical protein
MTRFRQTMVFSFLFANSDNLLSKSRNKIG